MTSRNQPAARFHVRWLPADALTPDPRNARIHSARQVARIADSIAAFGFNAPILIDGKGGVLAGHGRLLAARRLGLREVPTITLDHLSEAQARAFMLADNRLGELASWDGGRLGVELQELKSLDLDFALEATGFELSEIELRIDWRPSRRPMARGRDQRSRLQQSDQRAHAPVGAGGRRVDARAPSSRLRGRLRRRGFLRDRRCDPAMAGRDGRQRAPSSGRRDLR